MASSLRRSAHNRIRAVLAHTNRYAFSGEARLARDAGLSRSAVSRFLSGKSNPSFALVMAITRALEQQLGKRIDPRELISLDGAYPTPSVCKLCCCRGCLPKEAYAADDTLKPEYQNVRSGEWSLRPSPKQIPGKPTEEGL